MDAARRVIRDGALYIEGNEIKGVGKSKAVLEFGTADRVIDARGKLVLPGLINTHHHLYQTLFRSLPLVQNVPLFEWLKAYYDVWRELTPEAIRVSTKIGLAELLISGCTTTVDLPYVFPLGSGNKLFLEELKAVEELGIRFHYCRGSMALGVSRGGLPPDDLVEEEANILRHSKMAIENYHDANRFAMCRIALGPCSPFSVTSDLMVATQELARAYGVLLHTHLAETIDEERFCKEQYGKRPIEYMNELGWLGHDVWFAHAVHLKPKDLKLLRATDTAISYCPSSNMRLGSGIAPITRMLKQGITVSLAVDGSASNDASNILQEARIGMLLQRVKYGATAMSATEMLELATIGGAKTLRRDDIGSLEPGKAADLIMIDMKKLNYAGGMHDPVSAILFCNSSGVDMSIINGKVIVENGQLLTVNLGELIGEHNTMADEILTKAEAVTGKKYRHRIWRRAFRS
jgi:cytosine/adenosine deaminase-related metal-dependent hydrolase